MGGRRLAGFCLNRIATHARTPSEAKPIAEGPRSSTADNHIAGRKAMLQQDNDHAHNEVGNWDKFDENSASRKIMVVVDSSPEAKRALLWALSHTVQGQDTLVLLHVIRLSTPSKPSGSVSPRLKDPQESENQIAQTDYEVPNKLKMLSKTKRPEVEVEVLVAEGKEKGPTIVSQAKKQGASLLILGQRKPSLLWRLLITWAGNKRADGAGMVEYCIQNAHCLTLAVRRKNRRTGGYLITSKRQKNFWLLA